MNTERVYGLKYSADRKTREIAAAIRADVKAAIASGELPAALVVSVRIRPGGGITPVISADITGGLDTVQVHDPRRLRADIKHDPEWHRYPVYTPEAEAILKTLKAISWQYNYDGSDLSEDYHDKRFYCWPQIAYDYREDIRKREEERACGGVDMSCYNKPEPAPEPAADYQLTEDELAYDPAAFGFIMHGGAMIDAGIIDSDILIVSPNTKTRDGDIVVIETGGALICAVQQKHNKLSPEGMDDYADAAGGYIANWQNALVRGKVVLVRRRLII